MFIEANNMLEKKTQCQRENRSHNQILRKPPSVTPSTNITDSSVYCHSIDECTRTQSIPSSESMAAHHQTKPHHYRYNRDQTESLSVSQNPHHQNSSIVRRCAGVKRINMPHISSTRTSLIVTLVVLFIALFNAPICIANEGDFSLRPFQSSQISRRQDNGRVPIADFESAAPVPRRAPSNDDWLTAPVPRGSSSSSSQKPSFQRIRLNKPSAQQTPARIQHSVRQPVSQPISQPIQQHQPHLFPVPQTGFTPNQGPLQNFNRMVGLPAPVQPIEHVRIVPTSAPHRQHSPPPPPPQQQQQQQQQQPQHHQPQAQPQPQNFRRVKPSGGTRRIKIKTASSPQPSRVVSEPVVRHSQSLVPNLPPQIVPVAPNRNAQRVRGRGPVTNTDDESFNKVNALDNEDIQDFGNRVPHQQSSAQSNGAVNSASAAADDNGVLSVGSFHRIPAQHHSHQQSSPHQQAPQPQRHAHSKQQQQQQPQQQQLPAAISPSVTVHSSVHTPTIPLTYYTTFTYLTTVLRGQHTALLSREIVSSTVQLKPLDRTIVTAIEFNEGFLPSVTKAKQLGTKTKGQTTTIYNVASRVQVFNDDLYKVIYATRGQSSSVPMSSIVSKSPVPVSSSVVTESRIEPTRASSSIQQIQPTASLVDLSALEKENVKFATKFTYMYTIVDNLKTRYSTRIEESTSAFNGDLNRLAPSLASSIDSDGHLAVINTKAATLPIGSRANGQRTTMVNLAVSSYLAFDNIRNAQLDIKPTKTSSELPIVSSTVAPQLSSSFEETSSVVAAAPETSSRVMPTPELSSSAVLSSSVRRQSPASSPTPVVSSVRYRVTSSRRPIRVKVKPIRSKLSSHISRISSRIVVSSKVEDVVSSSMAPEIVSSPIVVSTSSSAPAAVSPSYEVVFSSSPVPSEVSSSIEPTPTVVSENVVASSRVPEKASRRKIAYTVRRPGASGINRFFNRRPSSVFVHPSTSAVPESSSIEAWTPLVSSEVIESTPVVELVSSPVFVPEFSSISEEMFSSMVPEMSSYLPELEISSSEVVSEIPIVASPVVKPPKASRSRVVFTRLRDGANRWNAGNRIRVSSRKIFKSTKTPEVSSTVEPVRTSVHIDPSATVETIFETTTHTVPFTFGTSTLYTTLEETNTRVLTKSPISSSMNEMSSVEAEVEATAALPSSTITFETKTQTTTLTHFNTHYDMETSRVTSSEETLSSTFTVAKLEPVTPTVVTETTDRPVTSTLYSTLTYFATLFNGTQTTITPLEEVKTEYLTIREPVTITRTVLPTQEIFATPSMNMIQPTPSMTAAIEIMSSASMMPPLDPSLYELETYSTHTTLTHFITLFSGTRTILSSIEEISPTVMTRTKLIESTEMVSVPVTTNAPTTTPAAITEMFNNNANKQQQQQQENAFETTTTSPPQHVQQTTPLADPSMVELTTMQMPPMVEVLQPEVLEPMEPEMIIPPATTGEPEKVPTTTSRPEIVQNVGETSAPPTTTTTVAPPTTSGPISDIDVMSAANNNNYQPEVITTEMVPTTTMQTPMNANKHHHHRQPDTVIELKDLLEGGRNVGLIGEAIKDIVKDIVSSAGDNLPEEDKRPFMDNNNNYAQPDAEVTTQSGMDISEMAAPTTTTTSTPDVESSFGMVEPSLNSVKNVANNRVPTYVPGNKYYEEDKSDLVIFSTQTLGETAPEMSTRYVTSVDRNTKTLTLTSTKVYYTRDAPLTITSVLTTTLPAVTYVSTIIGSKTILGTYNSIQPTRTMSVSDTAAMQATTAATQPAPTTRPRLHKPKNQDQNQLVRAKVTPFLNSGKPKSVKPKIIPVSKNATLFGMGVIDADQCTPRCNAAAKEYCREQEPGKFSCDCRPGFVRRPSDNICHEIKNYLVTVRVSKTAESELASSSNEMEMLSKLARRQIGATEGVAGLQVISIDRPAKSMNLSIQLDEDMEMMESDIQADLTRKLQGLGSVEKIVDFDECSSPEHNDCSPRARCINEIGTYRCACLDNFIDLDPTLAGRVCVSEVKSCDYCHGRGDCWRSQSEGTVCRCHPMFIGRRCEINGLLLAVFVPIVAILVIVSIIFFLYCSRKLRNRNRRFKNLAAFGPVAVIGGTLDRKAMLETSSESSDPAQMRTSSHYATESTSTSVRGSMEKRSVRGSKRRESDPNTERSLATAYSHGGAAAAAAAYGAAGSMPPQIIIPRARQGPPSNGFNVHPGQMYMW